MPPEPRDPPAASRPGINRAPAPPRDLSRKREQPREPGHPTEPGRAEAGAGARPSPPPVALGGGPEPGISAGQVPLTLPLARQHRPRARRAGRSRTHGTSRGPGPSPGRGPTEGTRGTRRRSGAARGRYGALTDRQAEHVERHEDLPALHPAAGAAPRPGPAAHMARNGAGPAGR